MKKNLKKLMILMMLSINFVAYSEGLGDNLPSTTDLRLNRDTLVINKFEIKGNKNIDLSKILKNENIKKGDAFDKDKLQKLMNDIISTGYFETVTPNVSVDSSNKSVNVELVLVENKIIKKVNLEGINSVNKDELLKSIGLVEGSVFNYNYVNQETSPILFALRERGIYLPIILNADMNEKNELTIIVSEGKISKIEFIKQGDKKDNIRLDSSDFKLKTKDFVLERNLELKVGDPLTIIALKNTAENLLRTGYFETVEPRIEIDPLNPENRIVVFVISERRTASIYGNGSYSTSTGFVASLSLKDENFLGGHQSASISGSVGTTGSLDFRISYMNPWIRGTNNILAGGDLYFKRNSVSKKNLRENIAYDRTSQINGVLAEYVAAKYRDEFGFSGTIGKRIYRNLYLDVNPGINYEYSKTVGGLQLSSSLRGYTNVNLTYNTIDNPYAPRKGSRVRLSAEGVQIFKDSSISATGVNEIKNELFNKQKSIYSGLSDSDKKRYFKDYSSTGSNSDIYKLSLTTAGEEYMSDQLKNYGEEFKKKVEEFRAKNENFVNKPRFFAKFEFDFVNYIPIVDKVNSLATRIFIGKSTLGADKTSLFSVKGNGTFLRGFDTGDVTNFLMASTVENRFYLNKYLEGVVFMDTGLYANQIGGTPEGYAKFEKIADVFKNAKDNLRISIGAGVRVNTPIGMLRLDYGVPVLNNTELEGRGKIEFGLSESF
ncbi:BamA/OMP85 family outer membrane protein [Oceanivirga miroungae]|uniref:Surface antigen (D15) n=1 Tax=Oceanivirga miroungae TaxID=1130046 RepID=A0A6I8MCG2_9FUSO|nr:POTRA domain-containing protein [Oceanivirga miroungae]VWL85119.1 surface antigen (D15) [Oceanivirga miroungae]